MNENTIENRRYADVVVEISHEKVDKAFQYIIPEKLLGKVLPGVRVHVPFGQGNKDLTGYVVELSEKADYPVEKMKEIRCIDEKGTTLESDLIQTAYWMKSHYGSTMITALKTVLPVKQKLKQPERKKITRCCGREEIERQIAECTRKHQTAKVRVLNALLEEEILPYTLLREKLNVAAPTLNSLEKQGVIAIETESYYRNPVKRIAGKEAARALSEEQRFIDRKSVV